MRALIVDDDKLVRTAVASLLEDEGVDETVEASNGREALAFLKCASSDLIISDWSMPEMDGLELLKACKGDPILKDIPFVMSTGQDEKTEILTALEAGADAYIVKPLLSTELQEILIKIRLRFRGKTVPTDRREVSPTAADS